jgi:hypothetical protein
MKFEKILKFLKEHKILIFILTIFLAYYLVKLSGTSSYFLLFIFFLPFVILLLKNRKIGFYLIMIWVFFADWFVQIGLVPTQLTWLTEIVLVIYTLSLLYKKKHFVRTPIDIPVILFIIIGIISAVYNGRHPFFLLLAFRLDLRFILMFYLLVSFNLSEKFYKTMIKLFLILLVIQIPTALIKYAIYGQGEMAIGTYALYGGTYSTLLPLIAISLSGGMYIHKKPHFTYILLIFGFIVFSIVGGKKGLIYYGPLLLFFILLRLSLLKSAKKKLYKLLPVSLIILLMFLPIIYYVPKLKPAIGNPAYLQEFIYIYELQYTSSGDPSGRIPSSVATFENLSDDPARFLIGYGPGSMIKSYFKQYDTRTSRTQPIWTEYGKTELVQKSIEYGYLGFTLYLLIPMFLIFGINERFYKKIDDNYWKTISFGFAGIIFSYFIISIAYSAIMRGDLAGFIFWFFSAAVYSTGRKRKIFR